MIFHRTIKIPKGISTDELCAFCDGFVEQVCIDEVADTVSGQLVKIEKELHYFGVFDSWEDDPEDPEEDELPDNVIRFPSAFSRPVRQAN